MQILRTGIFRCVANVIPIVKYMEEKIIGANKIKCRKCGDIIWWQGDQADEEHFFIRIPQNRQPENRKPIRVMAFSFSMP